MEAYTFTDAGRQAEPIDATHRWSLPGVRCSFCREVWASTGLAYPSIDLDASMAQIVMRRNVVDVAEFRRMAERVREVTLRSLVLHPGAELGPLEGTCRRLPEGGIAWVNPWTPLFSGEVLSHLQGQGLRGLSAAPADLGWEQRSDLPILELEIAPRAHAARGTPQCDVCGRVAPAAVPEHLRVDSIDLFEDTDITRVVEYPTVILVTAGFRAAVEKLGLLDVSFGNVTIVGSDPGCADQGAPA